MFGRKSRGFAQIYEYGCGNEPISGLEEALDQMARRIQLWNRFVRIEAEVRRKTRLLLSDEAEQREIRELQTRIADDRGSLAAEQEKTDGQDVAAIEDLQQRIVASRAALRALLARVKSNRRERVARSKAALKILQEERAEQAKLAQRNSGLYWCNYDDVRHAYETARVRVLKEGTELRDHQWNGAGRVSVRFQRGLPVATAFTRRGLRLQIDPLPEEAWTSPVRATRRKLSRTTVRIRVASTPGEQLPIWLEIPVVIHRPLPREGTIRSAALIRERLAISWRYRFLITVACPNRSVPEFAERPDIALDLGWRLTPRGLRVAFWVDTHDGRGEVVVPASDVAEFSKVGDLWSTADKHFTETRCAVLAWRSGNPVPNAMLPYFEEVAKSHSPRSLLLLVEAWLSEPSGSDSEILARLVEWKRKHVHLWTWAANLRDQLTRRRRELFRRFAASLVKKYGTIFVERFDLRWFSKCPPAETPRIPIDGKYRVIAAPGILRQSIANACRQSGVRFERVTAINTTKQCHCCGRIEEWSAARELVHKCSCGAAWDQDYNAAVQILRLGLLERQTQSQLMG
jgi:putative transposase-like DNA-binding protein